MNIKPLDSGPEFPYRSLYSLLLKPLVVMEEIVPFLSAFL
jgi:hypothetical protein